ncbi:MAG: fructose-1,6-bisphosphate aldolase/phosphatase [Candidatus Aenigmatarchaeota archaeon]
MKTTLSVIKADIGSIGGHIKPSKKVLKKVENYIESSSRGIIKDYFVTFTGDDICILFSHTNGTGNEKVHELAWNAFREATEVAKEEGLYGAGQDLLKDAFSGNIKGMGPAVAEMEFVERPSEPFLLFAADKTDPGAYNLPLYLGFADPMFSSGLILNPKTEGYKFVIMDVEHTEGDRIIELYAPEELYDIAALIRDNERYVIEAIYTKDGKEPAVAVSTTRLRNIAGKYVGKDDPVMIVRTQGIFPATGEVLSPFAIGHYVAGFMRGSHAGPLMPVKIESSVSYFDGPPVVSCLAFCVHNGKLSEPADCFDQPFWDYVRIKVAEKAIEIRRQGFSGPSMLPFSELEYGGIVEKLKKLDQRFKIRGS